MTYEISISEFEHVGGTKSYELTSVTNGKEHYIIKRWGKCEAMKSGGGQIKIETFKTWTAMASEIASSVSERKRRDYAESVTNTHAKMTGVTAAALVADRLTAKLRDEVFSLITFDLDDEMPSSSVESDTNMDKSPVIKSTPSYGDWGEF